jgi:hypothetical protein
VRSTALAASLFRRTVGTSAPATLNFGSIFIARNSSCVIRCRFPAHSPFQPGTAPVLPSRPALAGGAPSASVTRSPPVPNDNLFATQKPIPMRGRAPNLHGLWRRDMGAKQPDSRNVSGPANTEEWTNLFCTGREISQNCGPSAVNRKSGDGDSVKRADDTHPRHRMRPLGMRLQIAFLFPTAKK